MKTILHSFPCLATMALAGLGILQTSNTYGFDDGAGKDWRPLGPTAGLTWAQVTNACAPDGVTPCVGVVAGRDLNGWVWATESQVLQLFGIFAPSILTSPSRSVAGPEYVTAASSFMGNFGLLQHFVGCPTYQPCFNVRISAGWAATEAGLTTATSGSVAIDSESIFGVTAGFNLNAVSTTDTSLRGVFLWRPTGLGTGGIYANDDSGVSTSPAGGTAIPSVLANDWLNGARPTTSTVTLSQLSPAIPGVTLLSDGSIVTDAGTPSGTYTITYQICDAANPSNCDSANATVTVRSFPIVAVNDQASTSFGLGGRPIASVLVNDTLGGLPATTAVVSLTQISSTSPGVTLDPNTGAINVAPGTLSGIQTLVYRICERANPANCAQATATLSPYYIDAVNDYSRLSSKLGGSSVSVLANDTFNGMRATTDKVKLSLLSPLPKGVTFSTSTGIFTVKPKTTSGTYLITYQIEEIGSPSNRDQALMTLDLSGRGQ